MAPLSKKQRVTLIQLARELYEKEWAREDGEGTRADAPDFDNFRHGEVYAAVGKSGLRACGQDDFLKVKAHLLHRLGRDGAALEALLRAGEEGRRRAWWLLNRAIGEAAGAGITRGYVEAISRAEYGRGIEDCSEKQLWQLMYTVRSRASARRRGAGVAAGSAGA
jgi:hypothetical protein